MKKFFSKFLKDTRGVVMMEYVVLGCFAVAVTVVMVIALGKVYNGGLATMAYATAGETTAVVANAAFVKTELGDDVIAANEDYAEKIVAKNGTGSSFDYDVF